MIAVISKTTSDSDMPVTLELIEPALYAGSRRVSITKTLDQGVSHSDMGFSPADRRYSIRAVVTKTVAGALQTLLEDNEELTLALWEGLFKVVPLNLRVKGSSVATFNFSIKSKLSA